MAHHGPPPPAVRRVAEAAGAPGQTATNAAPTTGELTPAGSESTFSSTPCGTGSPQRCARGLKACCDSTPHLGRSTRLW